MKKPVIGINLPNKYFTPQMLKTGLERIVSDGYDFAEISLHILPLIIGGRIVKEYVNWLGRKLREYPLRYSGHIDTHVDLRAQDNYELNKEVLYRSIDICNSLSISPLVLHFEHESNSDEIEERFYRDHLNAAEYAAEREVVLCIENIEVEYITPVIRMVETLRHPNFRMCLDVGHAYLASGYLGFDFLETLKSAKHLISHVHMSGNTGVFEPLRITNHSLYNAMSKNYRFAFGRGDIHAPPLWGTIPYESVFEILRDIDCTYLCEYDSERFIPFNRSIGENIRRMIQRIQLSG